MSALLFLPDWQIARLNFAPPSQLLLQLLLLAAAAALVVPCCSGCVQLIAASHARPRS